MIVSSAYVQETWLYNYNWYIILESEMDQLVE
jgi:hypothetical protein